MRQAKRRSSTKISQITYWSKKEKILMTTTVKKTIPQEREWTKKLSSDKTKQDM
jgi:hypothetical protein